MNGQATEHGRVYLIGAGPGDPKLLTIRAVEALSSCDLIVYDYLVNPQTLAHARRGAELIYVGKHAGEHTLSQAEINRLLVTRARAGQVVARLKGGDPFIFGRGGEEAEALVEAGVKWEVIPGISSGVAAAAYAGIPLTHRNYSSSVAFITGHDGLSGGKQAVDWSRAAHAADTLVIFMCAETIPQISRALILNGRSPSTPIAIIRWGTYEHQELYSGALEDVAEFAASDEGDQRAGFPVAPPAIAIIGDVVALKDKLGWFGNQESIYSISSLAASRAIAVEA
jgi:uroporphyrin-III C-methyltransferase